MFGINKPKIITDENKINELLTRGVENIYPTPEFLKSKLMKGERVSIYLGIDPTGKTLHLGHVIPLFENEKISRAWPSNYTSYGRLHSNDRRSNR